ncbi:MAG TPA: hypothetical protein GXZ98_05810 [Firmicutes bacterium]|jgi:hypothetical protein|nr:hypothetical protein [Bacillota bacterium]
MDRPRFENLCDILKRLKGEQVLLLLDSGDREKVKVVAVIDDVLVATVDRKFIFVDCECICAVIADCLDVIAKQFDLTYEDGNAVVEETEE